MCLAWSQFGLPMSLVRLVQVVSKNNMPLLYMQNKLAVNCVLKSFLKKTRLKTSRNLTYCFSISRNQKSLNKKKHILFYRIKVQLLRKLPPKCCLRRSSSWPSLQLARADLSSCKLRKSRLIIFVPTPLAWFAESNNKYS
jgi:hypothetical protein